jgi:hypothetical protein
LVSGFFGRKIPAPPPSSPPVSCALAVIADSDTNAVMMAARNPILLSCFGALGFIVPSNCKPGKLTIDI